MTDPRPWATPGSDEPAADAPAPLEPEPPADESETEGEAELQAEIPLRPLGVSEILDGAVTYIRRNPRATLGMSAALTSVVEVIVTVAQYFFIGSKAREEVTPGVLARTVGWAFITVSGGMLLTAFVVLLLSGLLAPVMARTLLGRATSFTRSWRAARPSVMRLLGVSALLIAIVILSVAVPFVPLAAAVAAGAPVGLQALAWIFAVPVSLVLMVSSYVWFALAAPILIMERRGVIASLRRSAEIVRGRWWRTFGVLVLAQVIAVLAGFVVLPMPFSVAGRIVLGFDSEPTGWTLIGLVALSAIGRIVAGTLANPFNAGVIAMLYADRRMRREAFDLELQMDPPDDPLAAWLPGPLTAAGSGPQPMMPRSAPPAPHTMAPPPGWH
ncbi:hypothetical protein [Actinomadura sp. DC4]|uniref:DUF7544 domain-containing protein n=1 Tax=Actinomadura sp. DC4 TaxID=3055069 RepID=UPI0025AF65A2|nr:hypothetical protein [Actinomadura sp. DC4]MDN3355546.1 hypothetical protein [Actinomadura sp. DC4]